MTMIPTHTPAHRMPNAPQMPPGIGGPGAAGGLTGRDVMRIFRKRIWLILLTILITEVLTVIATGVWLLTAPQYFTQALLTVAPPRTSALGGVDILPPKDVMERLLLREVQMVKTETVLDHATQDENFRRTKWFKKYGSGEIIEEMKKKINASPLIGTDLIRISMSMSAKTEQDRREQAEIVNAVAKAYIAYSLKNIREERQGRVEELVKEQDRKLDELKSTRGDMALLQISDISALQQHNNRMGYELQMLIRQAIELGGERASAQTALDNILEMEQQGILVNSGIIQAQVSMDGQLNLLFQTRVNVQTQLDDAKTKFGPGHKRRDMLENQLASIATQIDEREKQVTSLAIQSIMRQTMSSLEDLNAQMTELEENLEAVRMKLANSEETLGELARLEADEKALKERLAKIEPALDRLRVLARGERRTTIAHYATTPRIPSAPKWKYMIPIGLFLGVAIGFGLAFLLELIDTSVKSPADLTKRVELPVLGMVPHTDDIEEEIEHLPLAYVTNPDSIVSEAFRQIRTCLLFSSPLAHRRSVLITSPMPEDGRATVSMNLAGAIAGAGKKVLLVDTNFRQPAVQKFFPQLPSAGLSSALVGKHHWSDLVMELDSNLFMMSAGAVPPNPTELLGSDQMRDILAEMVEQYDQVLLKGTPCLVVSDSVVLSTLVDGVIMVVRAGANTYGVVQRARDMFTMVGARIIGVVLNGVRHTAGGYYRQAYEAYYDYQELESLPGSVDLEEAVEIDKVDV